MEIERRVKICLSLQAETLRSLDALADRLGRNRSEMADACIRFVANTGVIPHNEDKAVFVRQVEHEIEGLAKRLADFLFADYLLVPLYEQARCSGPISTAPERDSPLNAAPFDGGESQPYDVRCSGAPPSVVPEQDDGLALQERAVVTHSLVTHESD